jgi:hypothetical protein
MRILKLTLKSRLIGTAMAALLGAGVAGAASAGTVYSWQTEDGTYAYTDDRKRIPARYRGQAKSRSMEQLSSYKRFTPSTLEVQSDYAKRLQARRNRLSDGGAVSMVAPGAGGAPTSAAFLVRTSGNRNGTSTALGVPVRDGGNGPITVDNVRSRPDSSVGPNGSMATRHLTVVRQGGRVISVTRPQLNQTRLDGPRDSDFLK